jgi:hypothetical protein
MCSFKIRYRLVMTLFMLSPLFCGAEDPAVSSGGSYLSFEVPGALSTVPLAINDLGAVTGYYYSSTVALGGFVRGPLGSITTFEVPGSGQTEPVSINVFGDVTGYWGIAASHNPPWQGFVRSRWGVFTSINIPGSTSVWPVRINDSGTVVGYYSTATDYGLPYYGFVRSPDGVITTFNAPGGLFTLFAGINDAGEIIGCSYNGVSGSCFELSRNGILTTLNVPPASINREGDITGTWSQTQGFVRSHAGAVTYFNVPGAQWGTGYLNINNRGYVMGGYSDQPNSPISHGFLRSPDGVITSFDPPGSATTIATSLNNANVITGFYYIGTSTSALGFLRFPSGYCRCWRERQNATPADRECLDFSPPGDASPEEGRVRPPAPYHRRPGSD